MKRKHKYRLKNKLLALLMVLSGIPAFAQSSGTSCGTAIPLNISSSGNITTDVEIWYSFSATGTGQAIEVVHSTNSTHSHFHKAAIISGSCGNVTVLDSAEIGTGDSVLTVQAFGLTANSQYYVRLTRDVSSTTCGTCTNNSILYSISVMDPELPYSCTVDPFVCNYISNPGFESGPHPTMVRGIRNHYATCWDATRQQMTVCALSQPDNTPDLFDITAPLVYGNCQQPGYAGIPKNNFDDGYVMPRTANNTRFAHMLSGESMDGALTATLTPDKYYFEFWYAMPTCGGNIDGYYCVNLFNGANTAQNMHIGTAQFNQNWDAANDGQWHVYGMCVDLSTANASTLAQFDKIKIHTYNSMSWFVDDFSLTKMADAGNDQTVCIGNSTQLGPQCTLSSASYSWSPSTGLSCSTCPDPIATPTVTTTYTLTVTDAQGTCTATDQVTVNVVPQPSAAISGNIYKCPVNNSTTFTYQVPLQANCTYQWSVSNVSAPLVVQGTNWISVDWSTTLSQPSTITVIVTDTLHGCSVKGTLDITGCCINPVPQSGPTYLDPVSSIVFPSGFISGTAYINGTLTINQNLVANNVHWYFGTNAKVKILPGVSVRIQESVLEAGCGVMWDGILIMDSTAYLEIDVSTVEDAKEAVRSDHGGEYLIHGNTKLNKNRYGVVVSAYNNNHPGIIKETEITCLPSPFSIGNYLLPPMSNLRTDAGVLITDVKNITVGSTLSPGDKNRFENMNIGIRTVRSNTNAFNNEFRDIVTVNSSNVAQAAYWATGKHFSFPPISFVSYSHNIGSTAANAKNYFINCVNGVKAEINLNVDVTNNKFSTIRSNAISVHGCGLFNQITVKNDSILNAQTGVRLTSNNNVTAIVDNNFIEYNATPPSLSMGSYGTGVFMSQTSNMTVANYTVSNNTLSRLKIGVQGMNLHKPHVYQNVITLNPGTWWINALRGVSIVRSYKPRIISNDISTLTATTAPQKGGIYVSSSQQSVISCNDISDIGYDIQCSGTPMTSSTINKNDLYDSRWGLMVSNSAIIGQQGTFTAPSCNTWTGSFTAGLFSSSNAFGPIIYHKNSFPYIPPSSAAINSQPWQPTQSSSTSGCKGCYWYEPVKISALESQVAGEYDLTEESQWMLEHAIYQMMRDDSSTLADSSEALATFANELDEQNIGIYEQAMQTLNNSYTSTQEIENTKDAVEATTPANVLEEYFKTVIGIHAEIILAESDPTKGQIEQLQEIAVLCPFTDGPAVYIARGLLASYDSTLYINDCELSPDDSIGVRMAQPIAADRSTKTQVYPNPVNDELSVVISLKEGEKGTFDIYDARGSKVVSQTLKAGDGLSKVKVGNLSPGVYFYKIVVNDLVVDSNKLVIIK